jgi:HD-like signal output (HDOD) protein
MYQRVSPATDINMAIVRLGFNTTRNISTTYAMRSLFKPKMNKLKPLMTKLWQESAELAATSAVLATRVSKFPFDEALTAGLVQDIGVLPMLEKLHQLDPEFDFASDLTEATDKYAAKVGALVLHKWNFPDELVEVVRSRQDWYRDKQPEPQLADVVLIARLLIQIRRG